MNSFVIVMAALVLGQDGDSEKRYREALYLEVDRGEVDEAIALYAKVEADAGAGEALRARAAFRRAWCLEKKGQKVEAERAYRDVASRYAGQAEVAGKARERLDRLATSDGAGAPASMEDRIAALVVQLGLGKETGENAFRQLVLIGEPAVPALRRALAHKDGMLSGMAACILVEMEQDNGTYPILMRGLKDNRIRTECETALCKLIRRQEGLRKDFVEAFLAEADPDRARSYFVVAASTEAPEARERLKEFVIRGPINVASAAAGRLRVCREEELLDLLRKLEKAGDGPKRAWSLISSRSLKSPEIRDTQAMAAILVSLFPSAENALVRDFVAENPRMLEKCAGPWLLSEPYVHYVADRILELGTEGVLMACRLMEGEPRLVTTRLGDELGRLVERANAAKSGRPYAAISREYLAAFEAIREGGEAHAALQKTLWTLMSRAKGQARARALWMLNDGLVPDNDARSGELVRAVMAHNVEGDAPINPEEWLKERTEEGKKKAREVVNQALADADERVQEEAVRWIAVIGDETRLEPMSRVALDPSRKTELRAAAIASLRGFQNPASVRPVLAKLVQDKDPAVRKSAVKVLSTYRGPETRALIVPFVEDPDSFVSLAAVHYFATAPTEADIEVLGKALSSENADVRNQAVLNMGMIGTNKVVPYLIRVLEDPNGLVQSNTREALEKIKKRDDEIYEWKKWAQRIGEEDQEKRK